MASEIRVDKINSLSGVGTVTLSPTGVDIAGITTVATLKATTGIVTTLTATTGIVTTLTTNTTRATTGIVTTLTATTGIVTTLTTNTLTANSTTKVGSGVTLSPDGDVFATGICTATSFSGDGSSLTGISGGLTVSDQWRLSALQSITTSDVVLTNWERPDTSGTGGGAYLGSGMSQSSGVFSFPTTGIYLITFIASINVANNAAVRYAEIDIVVTKDNSSYVEAAAGFCCINRPTGEAASGNVTCNFIMDVENVSNDKVRFESTKDNVGNHDILGSSTINYTTVTFLRLGDT